MQTRQRLARGETLCTCISAHPWRRSCGHPYDKAEPDEPRYCPDFKGVPDGFVGEDGDAVTQRLGVDETHRFHVWVGTRSSIALWARCSALSTETGVISSVSAISRAEKPRTSRSIRTSRCRAGRCWNAAAKASSMLSRCS
jgi:hypothetical protein